MTESTASTLEETSLTSPPPTPSEGKSVYRSTFAAMNMRITEGFLQHHPALHKDVKEIIAPTRCISAEMKDKVFTCQVRLICSFHKWKKCQMPFSIQRENVHRLFTHAKRTLSNISLREDREKCIFKAIRLVNQKVNGQSLQNSRYFCLYLILDLK